ncbi:unnamed protein product [Paramecium sonneborni]|uniref:Uncharacterized protein n=1 Tax=Paramecium sonneborni TaxID=65129 RepID=A0A8S1Q6Z3_9CILI|nr:unnamed protein product [Paramecium sonneborni]
MIQVILLLTIYKKFPLWNEMNKQLIQQYIYLMLTNCEVVLFIKKNKIQTYSFYIIITICFPNQKQLIV